MKTKAHVRYRNKAGDIVPGVSTIVGLLDKPALIPWANKLGLEGINSRAFSDNMSAIGTLAHRMIMDSLKGEDTDTSDYTKDQIDRAENSFLSWLEWAKKKEIIYELLEAPLVSEDYQYGGTLDFYGSIDGVLKLADWKTGGIWKEHYVQLCGYYHLLEENGYPVPSQGQILGIPRTVDEKFQEVSYNCFDIGWELFRHLRQVYGLLKEIQ